MLNKSMGVLLLGCAMLSGRGDKTPTYDAACPVPLSGWRLPKDGIGHLVPVLLVRLRSDGEVFLENHTGRLTPYEGHHIEDDISKSLAETLDDDPPTHIVLDIAATTPCKRVEQVRLAMQQSGACPMHCSEGRDWETWPFGKLP
jgi:hypothetical protein